MATWRELLMEALRENDESWADVEATTLTDDEIDIEFDDDLGIPEGVAFTLWTKNRVYFPTVWDGSEWASSAPRNPCDEATDHIGGQ